MNTGYRSLGWLSLEGSCGEHKDDGWVECEGQIKQTVAVSLCTWSCSHFLQTEAIVLLLFGVRPGEELSLTVSFTLKRNAAWKVELWDCDVCVHTIMLYAIVDNVVCDNSGSCSVSVIFLITLIPAFMQKYSMRGLSHMHTKPDSATWAVHQHVWLYQEDNALAKFH